MAKQFPIRTNPDRFQPGDIDETAPVILRDGTVVVIGDRSANPVVLAKPNANCCCNDEVGGCAQCSHFENELFDDSYFDCVRLVWQFDNQFTCTNPNDFTLCCRTFLPTPRANVQVDSSLGGYYFPNSCFSMRISLEPFDPQRVIVVQCCFSVVGIRYHEASRTAETFTAQVTASYGNDSISGPLTTLCDRIIDDGDTYRFLSLTSDTNVTQWENIRKVNVNGGLGCGESGSFGTSCVIKDRNADLVQSVTESAFIDELPIDPPFTLRWTRLFDSSLYLTDPSFQTQFNISPEAAIDIRNDHSPNANC